MLRQFCGEEEIKQRISLIMCFQFFFLYNKSILKIGNLLSFQSTIKKQQENSNAMLNNKLIFCKTGFIERNYRVSFNPAYKIHSGNKKGSLNSFPIQRQ